MKALALTALTIISVTSFAQTWELTETDSSTFYNYTLVLADSSSPIIQLDTIEGNILGLDVTSHNGKKRGFAHVEIQNIETEEIHRLITHLDGGATASIPPGEYRITLVDFQPIDQKIEFSITETHSVGIIVQANLPELPSRYNIKSKLPLTQENKEEILLCIQANGDCSKEDEYIVLIEI